MKIIANKILQIKYPTSSFCLPLSIQSKRRFTSTVSVAINNDVDNDDDSFKSNNMNGRLYMDDVKNKLARAAMKNIPHYGWTQDSITVAAMEDPKLNISMSGMLSPSELVCWFMDDMNHQLRRKKEEKEKITTNEVQQDDDDNKYQDNWKQQTNTTSYVDIDIIFNSIQWRLQQVLPFVESGQWHRAMAMGLSTPQTTQSQLHEFIEIIAPENSTTAYRTALGAIFVSTELFLLVDTSPSYADTWSFLKYRLDELEYHQKDFGKSDIDLSRFVLNNPLFLLVNNLTTKSSRIPIVASMAIGRSLLEGAASLVLPKSFRVLHHQQHSGTNPRDYESPLSSSSSSPPPRTK